MNVKLKTIAFDADDTLWQNEQFFQTSKQRFVELLSHEIDAELLEQRLLDVKLRNLPRYGFGVKGAILSLIETAIDVTNHRVSAHVIAELITLGHELLSYPIELLPHVSETLHALSQDYALLLITKGDLVDQERKIAQSDLGDMFDQIEIVSHKTSADYARIFGGRTGGAEAAMMVGNSLKSDVIPALQAGAWGVFVPHDLTWEFEQADAPKDHGRYRDIQNLGQLPELVNDLI